MSEQLPPPQPAPPPPPPAATPTATPAAAAAPAAPKLKTLRQEKEKLILDGGGLRYIHLPAHCIFRSEDAGVVTAVIANQMGNVVALLSALDQDSLTVLGRIPFRPDPVAADKALNTQTSAPSFAGARPPAAIPEIAGHLSFDGHVLEIVIGDDTLFFRPDDPARPLLAASKPHPEGGLVVDLEVATHGRVRVRVSGAEECRQSQRAVLFLRTQQATATRKRTRWEYRVVRNMMASSLESSLNELGRDGWEVVSITGMDGAFTLTGNKLFAVVKRAIA